LLINWTAQDKNWTRTIALYYACQRQGRGSDRQDVANTARTVEDSARDGPELYLRMNVTDRAATSRNQNRAGHHHGSDPSQATVDPRKRRPTEDLAVDR